MPPDQLRGPNVPDLVQDHNAAHNLFNGLVGLGGQLKQLNLRAAANLIQAILSVVGDIATQNWIALPRDLKALIQVILDQVPEEHVGAVVAFADLPDADCSEMA